LDFGCKDFGSGVRSQEARGKRQEAGIIYFGFWMQGFWIVFVNSNLKSKI
jgi:hypothetical protein